MMKKTFLFLILSIILGFSIFYSGLCFLSGSSGQLDHKIMCSGLSYSCVYLGTHLSPLFIFALIGVLLLVTIPSIPKGFVVLPFKPPRLHA